MNSKMYCSFIKSALRGHRLSSQLRPSFRKPQIQNTRLKITLEPQIINQRVFLNLALIVCLILRTQLIKIILDPWTKAENVALKDKADKFLPNLTAQMAVEAHSQEHAVSKMSIKHKRQLLESSTIWIRNRYSIVLLSWIAISISLIKSRQFNHMIFQKNQKNLKRIIVDQRIDRVN